MVVLYSPSFVLLLCMLASQIDLTLAKAIMAWYNCTHIYSLKQWGLTSAQEVIKSSHTVLQAHFSATCKLCDLLIFGSMSQLSCSVIQHDWLVVNQ
jgi:hypothetical protein